VVGEIDVEQVSARSRRRQGDGDPEPGVPPGPLDQELCPKAMGTIRARRNTGLRESLLASGGWETKADTADVPARSRRPTSWRRKSVRRNARPPQCGIRRTPHLQFIMTTQNRGLVDAHANREGNPFRGSIVLGREGQWGARSRKGSGPAEDDEFKPSDGRG